MVSIGLTAPLRSRVRSRRRSTKNHGVSHGSVYKYTAKEKKEYIYYSIHKIINKSHLNQIIPITPYKIKSVVVLKPNNTI